MQRDLNDLAVSVPRFILKACLVIAPVLAGVMAVTSSYNLHPDEIHHFEAAKYYVNHWLPPEIGDPSVLSSYSVYGVSYLNYHWIEYLLAGKFVLLLSPFFADELIPARLFNVSLFLGIAIFFIYRSRRDEDLLMIPYFLLITPQVWYSFSYVNNDAFALFIAVVAAYQLAYRKSWLNLLLESDDFSGRFSKIAAVGVLLGLILVVKTNYYSFLLFMALWLLCKFPPLSFAGQRPAVELVRVKKYALLLAVALAVLTFRCSLDFYVNGETNFVGFSYANYFAGNFEKNNSRLLKYQEAIAAPAYKPSTIENDLVATDRALKLKAKGTTFTEIFTKWQWHVISFQSFVGVYGYMTIFASNKYYLMMACLYGAFAVYLAGIIVFTRRRESLIQAVIFLAGVSVAVFISSYLSWSYAFQAQGRYLFPAIPMAAVFVYSNRLLFSKTVLNAFFLLTFAASVYSFVFNALRELGD